LYGPLDPFYGAPYPGLNIFNVTPPPPPAPIIVIQAPPTIVLNSRGPDAPRQPELRVPETPPVPPPDRKVAPTEPGKDSRPPIPDRDPTKEPKRPARKPDRDLPRPPAPEEDPREEHARLVRAGRQAFAGLEFGRAAQRFRQAVRLNPDEALPYFLLGQALLAQGNFHDAFDAIAGGMRRRPDWPTARFRPVELYGPQVDEYSALVRSTEKALARHPLDPELLFLRGYVLWFDGRKEEARPFFRKALPGAANRDAIDRFLRALPDEAAL
jgi:tetratricopeptide (TPR) repeat protein